MSNDLLLLLCVVLFLVAALFVWLWLDQWHKAAAAHTVVAVLKERIAVQEAHASKLNEVLSAERAELTEKFSKDFSILANDILEQKSRTMNLVASESMTNLLRPLQDNLRDFREKIASEGKERFALAGEVKRLAELNLLMSQQAQNLTEALRGNSKTQGDWGEMILETLLENSGLRRGVHFVVQPNLKSEAGANLRPDVILNLPDQKQVVIDSKVSLTAYVAYTEAGDAAAVDRAMALHITSLRSHIAELSAKRYDKLLGTSPDFVIMFVPTEPALLLGLQTTPELWNEAYEKGVILSSPSNLFGILKIVDDLWRRDTQSKGAIEIARQGGDLYDKLVGFAETFIEVGRSIDKTAAAHQRAMGQLTLGAGNLVRRAERLRDLGVKITKKMPVELSSAMEIEEDNTIE
ncbi:MAG: DNA recombination protein RmuC [Mucinivorans sp.]